MSEEKTIGEKLGGGLGGFYVGRRSFVEAVQSMDLGQVAALKAALGL